MKLKENELFLDLELQRIDNGSCGRSERLRSRSSIILSQAADRSIFHTKISPTIAPGKIEFVLGDQEDENEESNFLFTQLNELANVHEDVTWKETARWIRFEEKIEDGGERWSKPHVTTLTLHSLFELRTCFEKGIILLDTEKCTFKEIIDHVLKQRISMNIVNEEENENILNVLLQNHTHHPTKSGTKILKNIVSSTCRGKKSSSKAPLEFSEKSSYQQLKNTFRKKIPKGTEAANVLVGEVDFMEQPFVAFVRLKEATVISSLTEVTLPSRFIFILLGPKSKLKAYHEIGRAMATLLTDELFRKAAYKAMNKDELTAGIDDFLDEVAVLPPGKWDPTVRIQPPKFLPSVQRRKLMLHREAKNHLNARSYHEEERLAYGHPHVSEELQKTSKLFSGLIKDVQRKVPWYWSDFYDALNIQCLSAVLFIYLATLTNAITFGGMLGDATDNMQGVLENFIGTAICGGMFCLFSGQPLTILSSTGPVLVFERLLYYFSKDYNFEYLEFRLWIGLWVAFYCLILVATNSSYLVQYFTRFTEESFCALISCIFIYDAIKKMLNLADQFPINWKYNINDASQYSCKCIVNDTGNLSAWNLASYDSFFSKNKEPKNITQNLCKELGGLLEGNSCDYVPDVFLMSVILFCGTFVCTTSLKSFQKSRYLSATIRKLAGDFSVILTIVVFCAVDIICGLETPKLIVPSEFKPTNPNRSWFVFPFGRNPWWVCLLSGVPAILITILLFMDQQITAVILNRKENKLKKGAGLHLDFFCIALLIIVMSFMGLPWYVSATVISLAHMNSLKMETTVSAPGEQPTFLGIREQRVTGLAVFILTGASIFLSPVLKHIPMPVLYGIFLQMGVAALGSIQFMERLKLLFATPKHQPDLIYLRHVPLRKVHLFTLIQISCLIILWILKSTAAAIIFPLMLLALAGIRKAMECIFSLHDLSWLDDILPQEFVGEEGQKSEEIDSTDSEDSELKYQEKGPEINISVN